MAAHDKPAARSGRRSIGRVSLARALSKLGIASRSRAARLIGDGRVRVEGRTVRDPAAPVMPERSRIEIDDRRAERAPWTTILLHKPRGVVTTAHDPDGRRTVFEVVGDAVRGVMPVGRLDLASTGLLLLTSDTRLAAWLTDPANAVPRTYVVTVRGEVGEDTARALEAGLTVGGDRLIAARVDVRKHSRRESHLVVTLTEGRNREVRRLFAARGHEVTRLKRVAFGPIALGELGVGRWRTVSRDEIRAAFPSAPLRG